MSKQTLTTALIAIALVAPLAGQKVKVPKPPAYTPCAIVGDLSSGESTVEVGRDVRTYGPSNQKLYIDESLLPTATDPDPDGVVTQLKSVGYSDGYYGPYYGYVRVLDARIDYSFDTTEGCVQDLAAPHPCPFSLVVADGAAVYAPAGKNKTTIAGITFDEGRYLLYYRPCDPAVDPYCLVSLYGCYDERDCPGVAGLIYATLTVWFQ